MVDNVDQQPKHSMYLNLLCNPLKFIYFLVEWWHISSLWNCLMIKFHCWDCNTGLFTSFLLSYTFFYAPSLSDMFTSKIKPFMPPFYSLLWDTFNDMDFNNRFFSSLFEQTFCLGMGGVERFSEDRINSLCVYVTSEPGLQLYLLIRW